MYMYTRMKSCKYGCIAHAVGDFSIPLALAFSRSHVHKDHSVHICTYTPGDSSRAIKQLAYPTYWLALYENMKLYDANLEKNVT